VVLKNEIMYILWNTNIQEYGNLRYLIPMIGEQAKYEMASLKLKSQDEEFFIGLIDNTLGVYHEFFPNLKTVDDIDY